MDGDFKVPTTKFQSTLPVGGATAKIHKSICAFLKIMPLICLTCCFAVLSQRHRGQYRGDFLRITGAKGLGISVSFLFAPKQ